MRTTGYVLLLLLLVSCKSKKGRPADVFPPEKMQAVLWDMMRADQYVLAYVSNSNPGVKRSAESIKLYQQIFRLHQVSEQSFERSFTYYKDHPDLLKAILDSIAVSPETNTPPVKQPAIVPDTPGVNNRNPPPPVDTIELSPARLKAIRDSIRLLQKKQKLQRSHHQDGLQ